MFYLIQATPRTPFSSHGIVVYWTGTYWSAFIENAKALPNILTAAATQGMLKKDGHKNMFMLNELEMQHWRRLGYNTCHAAEWPFRESMGLM